MSPAPLRRRRSTFNPFLAVMLGALGVVGILLTLHFTEQVELPFIDAALGREVHANEDEVDLVAVIITGRELLPGEAVHRLDVWDATTQNFRVVRIPREQVRSDWILPWSQIEGRVMARKKLEGKAFKEADFLPKGTRPGVASLVPKGMRMVTIPADRVGGLEGLRYQDRFDLVAHDTIDGKKLDEAQDAVEGLSQDLVLEIEALRGATRRRIVAHEAMRLPKIDSKSKGGKEDLAIAVSEAEVPALLQAMKGESELFCVVYSGNDVEWAAKRISVGYDPNERLAEIMGKTREVRVREGSEVRTVRVLRYQEPEVRTPSSSVKRAPSEPLSAIREGTK